MEDLVSRLRKNILKRMLKDERYEWRKLDTLAHAVEANTAETAVLLDEMGARRSRGANPVYTLEF